MSAYETDFYRWALEQAEAVRTGAPLDIPNVAEELESLGRQQKWELRNRFVQLLKHRLKWDYQPEKRTRSWSVSIQNQIEDTADLVSENRSLRPLLGDVLIAAYAKARRTALAETTLDDAIIPEQCPYSLRSFPDLVSKLECI